MAKPKKETLLYVNAPGELIELEGIASSLKELDDEMSFEGGETVGIYKLVAVKTVRKGITLE